ncbi:MAG: hypothetical protein CVU64_24330 [Deltaproteobacteria bacterium HGW-Deltaproteobacteria-21]|nr:MAG: hypothetical protein CVU64_24330 [Deltaproteobacteria bacterium HGW-Deltaproteobacteria-21]
MNVMVAKEEEHRAYNAEVDHITALYRNGVMPDLLVKEIMTAFQNYHHPEHKAHFLYMLSKLLMDLGRKETAYNSFLETERLFRGTRFARASADTSKTIFVQGGGSFRPIPAFTLSVQIEPTNHCNLDCIMCDRNKHRPLGHMDLETFARIVDESLAAGAYGIRLYHMGEPLLNPSLILFVQYFSDKVKELELCDGCMPRGIGIMTNGTLLNSNLAEELMGSGLESIGFSIDGRTPEEYEKIRRNAKFSRVVENLRNTRKIRDTYRFSTKISVSVLDIELEQSDKSRLNDFYLQNGADFVSFMPCSLKEGRQIVNKNGDLIPAKEAVQADAPIPDYSESGDQAVADGVLDRLVVLWNGDIKSSCGEPSEADIIGNVKELSLAEAYQIKMKRLGLS